MIHAHVEHGVHIAAEKPRGGTERQWFMNAPAWKAITEKQVVDYCVFRHPYKTRSLRISGFLNSVGLPLASLVTVDVVISVSQGHSVQILADIDTTRSFRVQQARVPQALV